MNSVFLKNIKWTNGEKKILRFYNGISRTGNNNDDVHGILISGIMRSYINTSNKDPNKQIFKSIIEKINPNDFYIDLLSVLYEYGISMLNSEGYFRNTNIYDIITIFINNGLTMKTFNSVEYPSNADFSDFNRVVLYIKQQIMERDAFQRRKYVLGEIGGGGGKKQEKNRKKTGKRT